MSSHEYNTGRFGTKKFPTYVPQNFPNNIYMIMFITLLHRVLAEHLYMYSSRYLWKTIKIFKFIIFSVCVTVLAKTGLVCTKTEFNFIATVYRHTQYLSIPSVSSVKR